MYIITNAIETEVLAIEFNPRDPHAVALKIKVFSSWVVIYFYSLGLGFRVRVRIGVMALGLGLEFGC